MACAGRRSGLVGLRRDFGLPGVPLHHLLLHPLEQLLTAIRITAGPPVEPCHLLHIEIAGLEFSQSQLQGGLCLTEAEFSRDVVIDICRLCGAVVSR